MERKQRKQKIVRCKICSNTFVTSGSRASICKNDECQKAYKRAYYKKNKEKLNEYGRQRYLANREQILADHKANYTPAKPRIIQCQWCGKEFTAKNASKFCCADCKRLATNKRMRDKKRRNKLGIKICKVCGAEFTPVRSNEQECCSKSCYMKHYNAHRYNTSKEIRRCRVCGKVLTPQQQKYCSTQRRQKASYEANKPKGLQSVKDIESKDAWRCECRHKATCKYGKTFNGVGKNRAQRNGALYCAYFEMTGKVRGGYPDECTHYEEYTND